MTRNANRIPADTLGRAVQPTQTPVLACGMCCGMAWVYGWARTQAERSVAAQRNAAAYRAALHPSLN